MRMESKAGEERRKETTKEATKKATTEAKAAPIASVFARGQLREDMDKRERTKVTQIERMLCAARWKAKVYGFETKYGLVKYSKANLHQY